MLLFEGHPEWVEIQLKDILGWYPGANIPILRYKSGNEGGRALRDRFGCLWHRSEALTSYQCPGDPNPIPIPGFTATNYVGMWEAPDGTMVFPNTGSIAIGRPGKFRIANTADGLPGENQAIIARDGTVWLGGTAGLCRWTAPFRLEYWTGRDGLEPGYAVTRLGNKMLAGSGQGIAALAGDRKRWNALPQTANLGTVFHLLPNSDGSMYAGMRPGGIVEFDKTGKPSARSAPEVGTLRFARTADGQLWSAGRGIGRVQDNGTRLAIEKEARPGDKTRVSDIEFEPHTRKLWACAEQGLIHRESDGWHSVTQKDGLAENMCRSLAALPNGDVWIGYMGTPLFALIRVGADGKTTVRQYGPGRAGENAYVHFLATDSRGWLWRATADGVYVADPKDAEKNQWIPLNDVDGLPVLDSNQQTFFEDRDGSVWWSANESVIHFTPTADFVHPGSAPQVFLSGFSWNGVTPKLAEAASELPRGVPVTAHIGTLQFDRRNALRFRYRILPQQVDWTESRDLEITLGTTRWGEHKLEVQGRLGTGPWSKTAAHTFTVLPPFWATWPFLFGLAATSLAAGMGGYRWNKRRKEIERRALPDLHDLRLSAMVPETHALIGATLDGRFLPVKVLARGGFATVFDGQDQKQKCRCAIKVFHSEVADAGLMQRFEQEVTALETIVHPNVVRIYGHGRTSRGVPYLAMEFIEGPTLREAIPAHGLPRGEVASLLRQIGNALVAIHTHGICHRDLKPDNLMLRLAGPPRQSLVLIDFSIAIVKSPDKTVHGLSRAAGTIQYMAPEQAIGWADASSDIYSLAKVVMEMLTGKRLSELLPEASRDLPERVKDYLAGMASPLSADSRELIGSALEFDPGHRPSNALAFAEKIAADLDK